MKKKKLLIVLIIILIICGLSYLGINLYMDSLIHKTTSEIDPVKKEDVEETIIVDETNKAHKVVNFMLVGADNLDWGNREASYKEQRSDVFKIISLDYTDKTIKLTSLDRDVVVFIPDKNIDGEYGHFNWAYSFGGAKYAINTINYNLDLDVSKYVSFSFAGFIEVIDAIGGVDIELTQKEADAFNGGERSNATMKITAVEGLNHLDGYDALAYSRQRYVDSDFNRMNRQNEVIKAVVEKLKNCSVSELFDVAYKCLPYITTNLSDNEIKSCIMDIVSFDLNNIKTNIYPKDGPNDICLNKTSLGGYIVRSYSNQVIELHKYIYGTDTYVPTEKIYENEKRTYELFGEFYEDSKLLP